jgi:hypothetical protein
MAAISWITSPCPNAPTLSGPQVVWTSMKRSSAASASGLLIVTV